MGESVYELILAFIGRDMVTNVLGFIGKGLKAFNKEMEASNANISKSWMTAGLASVAVGSGMIGIATSIAAAMFVLAEHASKFQDKMVLISTHAGYTRREVDNLMASVLGLAGMVGRSPVELAEALFMVASAGVPASHAMEVLTAAAKEAVMGHAGVETTALSLTRILHAQMKAASGSAATLTDVNQAMNMINETVGHGQIYLENFNSFLGTGVIQSAKLFGVGFNEIGASLDILTRGGMDAEESGTRLRMGLALIAGPSNLAMGRLKEVGLTSEAAADMITRFNTVISRAHLSTSLMSHEMRTKGLVPALELLMRRLHETGMSTEQINQFLVRTFGGARSMTGLLALIQNIDELKDLSATIGSPENNFAAKWANASNTLAVQQSKLKESINATATALGLVFIPMIQSLLTQITPLIQHIAVWITEHHELIAKVTPLIAIFFAIAGAILVVGGTIAVFIGAVGGIIGAIGVLIAPIMFFIGLIGNIIFAITAVIGGAATFGEALLFVMGPIGWITLAIIALIVIIVLLITHWKQVKEVIHHVVDTVSHFIRAELTADGNFIKSFVSDAISVWNTLSSAAKTIFGAIASFFMYLISPLQDIWNVVTSVLRIGLIIVLIMVMLAVQKFQVEWTRNINIAIAYIKEFARFLGWLRDRFNETFNAVISFLTPFWNKLVTIFNTILTTIKVIFNAISIAVTGIWQAMWNTISTRITNAWATITTVFNAIRIAVTVIVSGMINSIISLWNGLVSRISAPLNTINNIINSTLRNIAISAWSAATGIGSSIVNGIIAGLRSAWGGLVSNFNSLARQLPGPIKSVLGIHSPSELFANEVGLPISQGIATGITQGSPYINQAMADAIDGAGVMSEPAAPIRPRHHRRTTHRHRVTHPAHARTSKTKESTETLKEMLKTEQEMLRVLIQILDAEESDMHNVTFGSTGPGDLTNTRRHKHLSGQTQQSVETLGWSLIERAQAMRNRGVQGESIS